MRDIRSLVVGYDAFDREEDPPKVAVELAREHGARIHLVHVVPPPPRHPPALGNVSMAELHAALIESRTHRLETMAAALKADGVEATIDVRVGVAAIELIRAAAATAADLVLVSDHPLNRDGAVGFGTVTNQLLRMCPNPVMAVRTSDSWHPRRILAAVDVDPWSDDDPSLNERIVEEAARFALRSGCPLLVLHVWTIWGEHLLRNRGHLTDAQAQALHEEAESARHESVRRLIGRHRVYGLDVEIRLVHGDARRVIPQVTKDAGVDLVVMGTVGRTGLPGFIIGNTAERILHRLPCSVLTVKPDGFDCPVDLTSPPAP